MTQVGGQRLILASGNRHKVEEIAALVAAADLPLEVLSMKHMGDPPEVAETATTFSGNATLKAGAIARWLRDEGLASPSDLVLADDSGICIDAFDGAPGVLSARFAGQGATDADNNRKLVHDLRVRGLENSPAHYVCVLALTRVDREETELVEGRCHGEVRIDARGAGGFGYDPHFWFAATGGTFAELGQSAKAAHSHRGAAVRRLLQRLPAYLAS